MKRSWVNVFHVSPAAEGFRSGFSAWAFLAPHQGDVHMQLPTEKSIRNTSVFISLSGELIDEHTHIHRKKNTHTQEKNTQRKFKLQMIPLYTGIFGLVPA